MAEWRAQYIVEQQTSSKSLKDAPELEKKARLRDLQKTASELKARNAYLKEMVALTKRFNLSTLPSSFLSAKSPMVVALSELNTAAAAVVQRLRSDPSLMSKKRAHGTDGTHTYESTAQKRIQALVQSTVAGTAASAGSM